MDNPRVEIVLGVALVTALALLRHFAARRVGAGQGRYVWLIFLPTLVGGLVILWAVIRSFGSAPLIGAGLAIGGLLYLGLVVRFITQASRSVEGATGPEDAATAITEPMADFVMSMTALSLIGLLVGLGALVVWAILQGTH